MINIPAKVKDRLTTSVKKFQPILAQAIDKDINESDTVTIIADILSIIFGYDKYTEITSEFAVKKTFCDLAIKIEDRPVLLIEVKSAGTDLRNTHIKQATDYGANAGIEWVALTNGSVWKIYKIIFAKPVDIELLYEFDLTTINTKREVDLELLYYLTKEAMGKSSKASLGDYHTQKQLCNKYTVAQIVLCDISIDTIRKVIKRLSPEAKISNEEIRQILTDEIIKRDALEDEKATEAKKRVNKLLKPPAPTKKVAPKLEAGAVNHNSVE